MLNFLIVAQVNLICDLYIKLQLLNNKQLAFKKKNKFINNISIVAISIVFYKYCYLSLRYILYKIN